MLLGFASWRYTCLKSSSAHSDVCGATVPDGTYEGISEGQNPGVQAVLLASDEAPEDAVYGYGLVLFDSSDDIGKQIGLGEEITKETAVEGITIPAHSGAESIAKRTVSLLGEMSDVGSSRSVSDACRCGGGAVLRTMAVQSCEVSEDVLHSGSGLRAALGLRFL